MVVQVALATTARIGQAVALDSKHRAALRALGDFQSLFTAEPRHRNVRTERGLRDAYRNRAVKIRAAPLKKRMFFHVQ